MDKTGQLLQAWWRGLGLECAREEVVGNPVVESKAPHVDVSIAAECHSVTTRGCQLAARRRNARCWSTRTDPGLRPIAVAT